MVLVTSFLSAFRRLLPRPAAVRVPASQEDREPAAASVVDVQDGLPPAGSGATELPRPLQDLRAEPHDEALVVSNEPIVPVEVVAGSDGPAADSGPGDGAEAVHDDAQAPVAIDVPPAAPRFHLTIPFDHAADRRLASPAGKEIVDASRRLLAEWIGGRGLLGYDRRSGLLWDLTGDEPVPVEGFDAGVHVLCNLGFLLIDEPPLAALQDDAQEYGACWTGSAGSREVLAYGLLQAAHDGERSIDPSTRSALRLVTATIDDAHDAARDGVQDDDWTVVADRHRVLLAHGPERSPAMDGTTQAGTRRSALSPIYWNTALADLAGPMPDADPDDAGPVDGDAERLGTALRQAIRRTRVPFALNALLNELELRTGATKPQSRPVEIHLSMTGRCNIECRFCGYTHDVARSDVVSLADVEKLDFLDHVSSLRLNSGLGEPTLNKNLGRIIEHVAGRFPHIAINMFTNAIPLGRPGLIDAIVGNVRWINLSFNAATREEWEVQCQSDHFERVCANVAALTRAKRERGSLWPILHASMVLNRSNFHELPRMPALCRELGIDRLTAFPYFALGFASEKFGPEMTLAAFRPQYDALYEESIEQARLHRVSIEIPLPSEQHVATFGIEKRLLHDFAEIEANDWPLSRLLTGVQIAPPGAHCHFLWRQAAMGSTNNAGHATDATHYMYPCLGPLSSVDLSRRTAFRFDEDFMALWHNPVFEHLRDAQHATGVCKVCDECRGSDTRDPAGFGQMERLVSDFSKQHSGIAPTVIDVTALKRPRATRSPAEVD